MLVPSSVRLAFCAGGQQDFKREGREHKAFRGLGWELAHHHMHASLFANLSGQSIQLQEV